MRVIKVDPIDSYQTSGFVFGPNGCGVTSWNQPVYPESPHAKEIRRARTEGDYLNLREAARLLDITPVEMSGLEWGRYTFATEREWEQAIDILAHAVKP